VIDEVAVAGPCDRLDQGDVCLTSRATAIALRFG